MGPWSECSKGVCFASRISVGAIPIGSTISMPQSHSLADCTGFVNPHLHGHVRSNRTCGSSCLYVPIVLISSSPHASALVVRRFRNAGFSQCNETRGRFDAGTGLASNIHAQHSVPRLKRCSHRCAMWDCPWRKNPLL